MTSPRRGRRASAAGATATRCAFLCAARWLGFAGAMVAWACERGTPPLAVEVPPATRGTLAEVPPIDVRADGAGAPAPIAPRAAAFAPGDAVEVEWHGDWWPARVLDVVSRVPAQWRIHYEGYGDEWDEDVDPERIRRR